MKLAPLLLCVVPVLAATFVAGCGSDEPSPAVTTPTSSTDFTPSPTTPAPAVVPTLPAGATGSAAATPAPGAAGTPAETPSLTPGAAGAAPASAPTTASGATGAEQGAAPNLGGSTIVNQSARQQELDVFDGGGAALAPISLAPGASLSIPQPARALQVRQSGKRVNIDRAGMKFKIDAQEDLVTVN